MAQHVGSKERTGRTDTLRGFRVDALECRPPGIGQPDTGALWAECVALEHLHSRASEAARL
eukprot:scaffold3056_cov70-Phaeocystis_antarctica.AAC.3